MKRLFIFCYENIFYSERPKTVMLRTFKSLTIKSFLLRDWLRIQILHFLSMLFSQLVESSLLSFLCEENYDLFEGAIM